MKILLRPRLHGQALSQAMASDPELAGALGAKPNAAVGHLFTKFFDAAGPLLPRILALGRAHGERLSFLRDLQFTASELDAARHLEVICRTTIGQTRPDADRTREAYAQEALQASASRWAVRLPQRIYLTKVVPPATIAHVDQWTGEYVCGAAAAQALRTSGLSGWTLAPVLHPRTGAAQAGMEHLTTRELLPAALQDATTFETLDDGPKAPSQPRRYGLIAYARGALDGAPDFARTAEPWDDWRTPEWIVSQAARRWFIREGLRGWAFWPVPEEGTDLHRQHLEKWTALLAVLQQAGAEVMA
jgi:hypothetical protein